MNGIPETPIQRILRENAERQDFANSEANIQVIANRLHRVEQLKANFGFTHSTKKTYFPTSHLRKVAAKRRAFVTQQLNVGVA